MKHLSSLMCGMAVMSMASAPLLAGVDAGTSGGAPDAAGAVIGQAMSRLASEDVLALDGRLVGGNTESYPNLGFTYTITFRQSFRFGWYVATIPNRDDLPLLGGIAFGLRTPQSPLGNTSADLLIGAKDGAKFFAKADLGFPLWRESVHFLINKLKYGFDVKLGYRYEHGLERERNGAVSNQHGLVLGLNFGIHFYR